MDLELQERVLEQLLARKAISQKELKRLVSRLQHEEISFEEALLAGGVDKRAYLGVLGGLLGCEWVDLAEMKPEPDLAALIPRAMTERYQMLSIGKRNAELVVAMADPRDAFAKEYVTMRTGLEVLPKLALERDLGKAIQAVYALLPAETPSPPAEEPTSPPDHPGHRPPQADGRGTREVAEPEAEGRLVGRGAKDCVDEHAFRTASQGRFLTWQRPEPAKPAPARRNPRVIEVSLPPLPAPAPSPPPPPAAEEPAKPALPEDRSRAMLTFLCELGQDLAATLEMEPLLLKLVETANHLTGGEGSSILLFDEKLQLLYFKCVEGEHGEKIKQVVLPLNEQSIAGWVGLHRMPLRIADVSKDPRHCRTIDELCQFTTRSILSVPVLFRGKLLGVMEVVNKLGGSAEFTAEDERWLILFASQAGVALANATMVEDLEEYFTQSVELLVSAVEALQPVLKGHIAEVARLSARIAAELGIGGEEYQHVTYAALLHDVGKLQLSGSSLEQMERDHPVAGARILGEMRRLAPLAPYVRVHHERYDGSGFPDGLSGEAIPLGGRILSLVEHYSEWKARDHLVEGARGEGTAEEFLSRFARHHDPNVVEVFRRVANPAPAIAR